MPAAEAVCRQCEPEGGPRSWRLPALREERLLWELSLETLADQAGVSTATARRAEYGRRVSSETAARLAGALRTSVTELAKTTEED